MLRTVLLILAAWTLAGCGDFVGISSDHPLGEFGAIDEYLAGERDFKKTEDKIRSPEVFEDSELEERLGAMKTYKFQDVGKGAMAGDIHVKVVVDGAGEVAAIVGRFHSRRAIWSDTGGRAESFIAKTWKEITGSEATFTREERPGPILDEYLLSEFDTGVAAGKWEKVPTTQRATDTNTLWDQVLIWRK